MHTNADHLLLDSVTPSGNKHIYRTGVSAQIPASYIVGAIYEELAFGTAKQLRNHFKVKRCQVLLICLTRRVAERGGGGLETG